MMLCILDGFGWVPDETYGNAIVAAKTPYLDHLFATCPNVTIGASGMSVGLPDGQMGNSEVGHTNMKNPVLVRNMKAAIDAGKAIHFMGLMGTGGVHSHEEHLFGLLDMAKALGAKDVYIHAIMDGRDTDPHDGEHFLQNVQNKLDEIGVGKIATVTGRYYAMDRDKNWDREEKAYAAFVYNEGERANGWKECIERSYANGVTDEFVIPCITCEGGRVAEGDTVVFINFRPDRARQMTRIFVDDDFNGFERRYGRFPVHYVCMTEYDATGHDPAAHRRDREVRPRHLLLQRRPGRALRRRGPLRHPQPQGSHLRPEARDERPRSGRRVRQADRERQV